MERDTIKKLQRNDIVQRRDLDLAYDKISEQRQRIERLERLLVANKVAVPDQKFDASPTIAKPAMGWGALTGNVGIGAQ